MSYTFKFWSFLGNICVKASAIFLAVNTLCVFLGRKCLAKMKKEAGKE